MQLNQMTIVFSWMELKIPGSKYQKVTHQSYSQRKLLDVGFSLFLIDLVDGQLPL